MTNKSAALLIIGDEILSGTFADENGPFAIAQFRRMAIKLDRITVLPDDLPRLALAIREASFVCDYVITSGGIGPTHDDVTVPAVAQAFSRKVVRDPMLSGLITRYWGEKTSEGHLRLADIPEGAKFVYGASPWPVVQVENVYLLPGVPKLFRRNFGHIAPTFESGHWVQGELSINLAESEIAEVLGKFDAQFPNVQIGSYPRFEETAFQVIVTLKAESTEEVQRCYSAMKKQFGPFIVYERTDWD